MIVLHTRHYQIACRKAGRIRVWKCFLVEARPPWSWSSFSSQLALQPKIKQKSKQRHNFAQVWWYYRKQCVVFRTHMSCIGSQSHGQTIPEQECRHSRNIVQPEITIRQRSVITTGAQWHCNTYVHVQSCKYKLTVDLETRGGKELFVWLVWLLNNWPISIFSQYSAGQN